MANSTDRDEGKDSDVKRSVLITGGAGRFGRRLVEKFIRAGWVVRVLDLPAADFSPFENREGIQIIRGDLTDRAVSTTTLAVAGVDAVAHLAALLPMDTEGDRARAFAVNVGATENVVATMEATNPAATLVFASSVAVYGDTSAETSPIAVTHPLHAINIYGESKIAAEAVVRASSLKTVVVRIAGQAWLARLEPPAVWPFTPEQRVEMVHRDDVVDALFASADVPEAAGKVVNASGGSTWRFREGRDYVRDFYGWLGLSVGKAVYPDTPGYRDWYETEESQRILRFQNRPYEHYVREVREILASQET